MRRFPLVALASLALSACSGPPSRTVEFVERVSVPAQGAPVRVWLPMPPTDPWQSVELVGVKSAHPTRTTTEPDFGNRILFLEASDGRPVELEVRYRITRREQRGLEPRMGEPLSDDERRRHTTPRGLLVVDESIRAIADEQARGALGPREKARRFYRYVLGFMAYDKSEPGWGDGDPLRACVIGKGNCTDFHSLFQSLAMASGVPSRFRMGVSLNGEKAQSLGRGYHCWAEFHVEGQGWIPVDISDAWKVRAGQKRMEPDWADRYFGTLDANRFAFSIGRSIRLEPPQAGPPLNYFAHPYVEVGGKPLADASFERIVKDVDAAAPNI